MKHLRVAGSLTLALTLLSCGGAPSGSGPGTAGSAAAPRETADEFVARLNKDFDALSLEGNQTGWVQATYITQDTQAINARFTEKYLAYFTKAVKDSKAYDGQKLSVPTQRAITLLRQGVSAPAPDDPALRAELAAIMSRMDAAYGEAKYCPDGPKSCKSVDELGEDLAKTRNYDEALKIWTGWHDQAAPIRKDYSRFVEIGNLGAKELGYKDLGALWRGGYDMTPDEFAATAEKLYSEVKPLYDALHCYTRVKLTEKYGADKVKPGEPIPAHLLGNMWAQQWNRLYTDVLMPYPNARVENADRALKEQKWDGQKMVKSAESFYVSLGFPALPDTFWKRAQFSRPRDREVVCHASAWDIDAREDVRIKTCLQPTEEDLETAYHELGHVYYYLTYKDLPYMFKGGANDGFHEAIGDTVNLSVTPAYLNKIGLVRDAKTSKEALLNTQMKMALDKVAFLPFGKVIDEWRWRVFSGEIKPADYNRTWWELRRKYQGIAPAVARDESKFDPGAKYHVPGNTPYTRYFLSFILQFQFQKALCDAAGFKGPLSECSIFGSKEAGAKFQAMLAQGASEPWQDTLQKLTGGREMSAVPITEYFAPLMAWLEEKNKGQKCGWQ